MLSVQWQEIRRGVIEELSPDNGDVPESRPGIWSAGDDGHPGGP